MTRLILRRCAESRYGYFGRIETTDHEQLCVTLEHCDRGNLPMVSCIPEGVYRCFRRFSPKRKYHLWELRDVDGRSNIQIHIGNTTLDTDGCILVGMRYGKVKVGKTMVPGILQSRDAFKKLMDYLVDVDEFELEVVRG